MNVLGLTDPAELAWRVVLSYLLGAVPFGFLMCRWIKGVDVREVGSGNIGATNAMRVLGAPLGLTAFFLDVLKGYVPAAFLARGDPSWQVACAGAAVCGHVWPVYLRFKGGKAVATGCGAILAIDPLIVLYAGLVWLVCLVGAGWVSVSSMAMGLAFPAAAWWRGQPLVVILGTSLLTLLILVRHRSNMVRLMRGTEDRSRLYYKIRGRSPRSGPQKSHGHE
jgi:glycerol-3-phosphate acyltransferase PlsY